jgi:hypothetical protein
VGARSWYASPAYSLLLNFWKFLFIRPQYALSPQRCASTRRHLIHGPLPTSRYLNRGSTSSVTSPTRHLSSPSPFLRLMTSLSCASPIFRLSVGGTGSWSGVSRRQCNVAYNPDLRNATYEPASPPLYRRRRLYHCHCLFRQ